LYKIALLYVYPYRGERADSAVGDESRSTDRAVTTSRDGAVLHITVDRMPYRNALTHSMIDTLIEVVAAAASDDALRAVHLRGAGTDFCGR
jgi:2-(1,2-epoxy-1,2-dihydrophenyl)acetyl-CoA isomerase